MASTAAAAGPDDRFGADLYAALGGTGNLVFAPASIAAALRMTLLGAGGETASQLAATLHLAKPQDAAAGLVETCARLDSLAGGDLTLRAPNTVWVQSGLPLRPDFTAALAQAACAQLRAAGFSQAADPARQQINDLIAEQTAGKITGLIPPGVITVATRLVLASALYLKAAWTHPFPPGATQDAPFYPAPGAGRPVPTMRLQERLRYRRGDGYQVAELPYLGQRLGMVIVLPDGPLVPVESRLAGHGLGGLLAGLATRQVTLALPRFRVTGQVSLGPALAGLGMPLAFTGQADFTGITTAQPVHISDVVHQAYLDVDEAGTEAAAATAVVIRAAARVLAPDPPVEMIVDRPFLFAITELASGWPLFLGRVTNPAVLVRGDDPPDPPIAAARRAAASRRGKDQGGAPPDPPIAAARRAAASRRGKDQGGDPPGPPDRRCAPSGSKPPQAGLKMPCLRN